MVWVSPSYSQLNKWLRRIAKSTSIRTTKCSCKCKSFKSFLLTHHRKQTLTTISIGVSIRTIYAMCLHKRILKNVRSLEKFCSSFWTSMKAGTLQRRREEFCTASRTKASTILRNRIINTKNLSIIYSSNSKTNQRSRRNAEQRRTLQIGC